MKKIALILLVLSLFISTANAQQEPISQTLTIDTGTNCRLSLETPLNSKLNEVGDEFTAILAENLRINGQIALPRGTVFQGRISQISSAKRGQKQGSMTLIFDYAVTKEGKKEVDLLLTAIDDYANEEKLSPNDEKGKVEGGRNGRATVDNAIRGSILGSVGSSIVLLGGGGGGTAAGSLGAGVAGGVILTKGKEVRLTDGTILRVKFAKPLTITLD